MNRPGLITAAVYPFQSKSLVANLVFSLLFAVLVMQTTVGGFIGGMISIPGWIILAPWFIKYCFSVGQHAAFGDYQTISLNNDGFQPFEVIPFIFTLLLLFLSVSLILLIGPEISAFIVAILMPGIISAFLLEGSVFKSLNPIAWLSYIPGMGAYYLLMVVVLIVAVMLAFLISRTFGFWITVFLVPSVFIGTFRGIGMLLYSRHEEIGYNIPASIEEQQKEVDQRFKDRRLTERLLQWQRYSETKQHDTALADILSYVAGEQDDVQVYAQIFSDLVEWPDLKMAAMFMKHYNEKLIAADDYKQAYANLLLIWDRFGPTMPKTESSALDLAKMAHQRQRDDIAIKILQHFETAFPDSMMQDSVSKLLYEIEAKVGD